jgi:GLPGLI family protein
MKALRTRNLLLLALSIFVTRGLFAQGLYYESVLKGELIKEEGQVSKTYLMPKMMKHVNAEDQDFFVLRLDKQKMISVDTKAKNYWERTFAEMEKSMKAASEEMEAKLAELQAHLKDLPEEQRKMMEKMVGTNIESSAGSVQMSKTGETRKISGFSCTKYVAKEGTKELMTIWTTKDIKGFEPLRRDFEELSRRMTSMNPRFMKGLIDAMIKVEGFPIQTNWGGITTTVTKVEQRSTPESEFAVPAGYTKVEPPADEMQGEKEPE